MHKVKIVSTGLHLPSKVQTAAEIATLINRSERWILTRTGVAERRIAEEPMDKMGAKAARIALGKGPKPDLILNASTTPLQLIPDSSVFIEKELGMHGIPSWSTHATCLSFLTALITGSSLIHSKLYQRILIISSEAGTPWRNLKQPESAALFGDGAAAVIIEATPDGEESMVIDWIMTTWPEGAHLTELRGGGTRYPPYQSEKTKPEDYLFTMKGPRVYRLARERVKESLSILLKRNNLSARDINWLIPHQASARAIEAAGEYGFHKDKVINVVSEYGNCIAASIPIALATAHQRGFLKRGDLLLLGGTGAGLSIAFMLIRW